MSKPENDSVSHDVRNELSPHESLTLEHLIRVATFPIYGLTTYKDDLSLQGFDYCTAELRAGESDVPWRPNSPQFLWQVGLHYDYLLEHQAAGRRIELMTTDIQHSPIPVSVADERQRVLQSRYPSPQEVPPMVTQARVFVIERFPLLDAVAVATVEYSPHARPNGRLMGTQVHNVADSPSPQFPQIAALSRGGPVWSFTLRNSEMWLDGHAYGWTQQALFAALEQVTIISNRPDILHRYQNELTEWQRLHNRNAPSA